MPAAPLPAPEPERVSEPEVEILFDREIAYRAAKRGLRICFQVLLLLFVCAHLREIFRLFRALWLAWPGWVHDWAEASFPPF